jgi:hypothetical protein
MTNYLKRHLKAVVAVSLGLAVVGGGTAAAAAAASANRPTLEAATAPASSVSGAGKGLHGPLGRLARRAVHGELTVHTKDGYQTVTFDRGAVTSANGTSITIRRPDGVSVTEALTPTTRYRGISGASAITTGKQAIVVSHDGTALLVAQRRVSTGSSGSSTPANPGS